MNAFDFKETYISLIHCEIVLGSHMLIVSAANSLVIYNAIRSGTVLSSVYW